MVRFDFVFGGWIIAASLLIPIGALAAEGCSDVPEEVQYSATFKLQDTAPDSRKLRLTIGQTRSGAQAVGSVRIAQIWSGDSCLATCKASTLDSDQAMDMECHGIQLSSLSTHVTLSLKGKPTLRFGTWLKGYEEAFLMVDLDRFSIAAFAGGGATPAGSQIARK